MVRFLSLMPFSLFSDADFPTLLAPSASYNCTIYRATIMVYLVLGELQEAHQAAQAQGG